MRRFLVWMTAGVLAGVVLPVGLSAQGYGIYEHGSCMMGRAGTGVASPCSDGSAVNYNPAGVRGSGRGVISGGVTYIGPSGDFTNDFTGVRSGLENQHFYIPHFYAARDFGHRFAAGVGVFAPYGLETNWGTGFEGRFLGYKSKIQSIYLQPTFAVQVTSALRVGGGVDVSWEKVNLRQRADLYSTPAPGAPAGTTFGNLGIAQGTDFADINLEGNGTGVGFNLGVIWQAHSRVSVGVKYLSQQKIDINKATATITQVPTGILLPAGNPLLIALALPAGTALDNVLAAQFTGAGPLVNQNGSTSLTFPAQVVVGLTVKATEQLRILGDVQWVDWKKFNTLTLTFDRLPQKVIPESYQNTIGYRVGAEYVMNPKYTARIGLLSHDAAAPDQTVTPNLPEGPRTEYTAGLGAELTNKLHLDVAYQYIDQADRRGRTTDGGLAVPTAAQNNGLYSFKASLVGATFTYQF
jgi:long-chain fatty acid transport protein